MKKRVVSILLCLLLLSGGGTAYAAAGGMDDPLISLSYVNDVYLPELADSIREIISSALSVTETDRPEGGAASVGAGGSVTLSEGQTVILLSGSAKLSVSSGSVVNATLGAEVKSGYMAQNSRYIVCEASTAVVTVMSDASFSVSAGAAITPGDGKVSPFTDVTREDWFFSDVVNAYERGLVNGMTASTYEPEGRLTAAQAVKLAACMHQLYHKGAVTLKNSGEGEWYDSYVSYAVKNGIMSGGFEDYNADINRLDFVCLLYNALPAKEYTAINDIPDGAVPDVSMEDEGARQIYAFYRAGILTGYTAGGAYTEHQFGPDTTIARSEVATILNRMFDVTARKSFIIG